MYFYYYMLGVDDDNDMLDLGYEGNSDTELKESDKILLQYVTHYSLQLMK